MKKKQYKVIEETVVKGRQSVEYRLIYTLGTFKIKIEIDVDSYDFQSSAVAYVWNGSDLKWNKVYSIPYQKMQSLLSVSLYNAEKQTKSCFQTDADTIKKQVEQILF